MLGAAGTFYSLREILLSQEQEVTAKLEAASVKDREISEKTRQNSQRERELSRKEDNIAEKDREFGERETILSDKEAKVITERRRLDGESHDLERHKREANEREFRLDSCYKFNSSRFNAPCFLCRASCQVDLADITRFSSNVVEKHAQQKT